jgi:hypothetical protein
VHLHCCAATLAREGAIFGNDVNHVTDGQEVDTMEEQPEEHMGPTELSQPIDKRAFRERMDTFTVASFFETRTRNQQALLSKLDKIYSKFPILW